MIWITSTCVNANPLSLEEFKVKYEQEYKDLRNRDYNFEYLSKAVPPKPNKEDFLKAGFHLKSTLVITILSMP